MCHATQHIHATCGHSRSVEVTRPCPLFSSASQIPCPALTTTSQLIISDPPQCAACSRRVERNIMKSYESQHLRCEAQMAGLRAELRAERDAGRRAEMRAVVSALVEELGDLTDRRNEEVAEVRFRQG